MKADRTMITFDDVEMINPILRTIEHGVEFTIKNNKYIILITFEFTVSRDNKHVNIYDRYKKIFEAMELVDNSTKIITTADKVLEHPKKTPSGQEYGTHLPFLNSIQKQHNVFVYYKVELEL